MFTKVREGEGPEVSQVHTVRPRIPRHEESLVCDKIVALGGLVLRMSTFGQVAGSIYHVAGESREGSCSSMPEYDRVDSGTARA